MPVCKNCGVELEEGSLRCPLCGTPLQEASEKEQGLELQVRERLEERDERIVFLFREIFSFFALAGILVVAAVDLAYGMDLGWSRIPLVSILAVWFAVMIPSGFPGKSYLVISLEMADLALLLFFLDILTPGRSWFLPLALPVTLILAVLILKTVYLSRRFGFSIPGGIATVLLSVALFVPCLELLIRHFRGGHLIVSWSLIVSAGVLPFILFFYYFEKKLKQGNSQLKKFFHV
jgi:hypothetical protein